MTYIGSAALVIGVMYGGIRLIIAWTPKPLRLATALSILLHLAMLGVIVALGYAFFHMDDPGHYDYVANWLSGQWSAGEFPNIGRQWRVLSFGYYYWVAAVYRVFGHHPIFVQLANLVFALLSALFAFRIAIRFRASSTSAHAAAAATLLYPTLAFWSMAMLKDIGATVLLLLCLDLASADLARPSSWRLPILAGTAVVLSWLRFYYGVLILGLGLALLVAGRRGSWRRAAGLTAVLLAGLYVCFATGEGPWYLQVLERPAFMPYVASRLSGGESSLGDLPAAGLPGAVTRAGAPAPRAPDASVRLNRQTSLVWKVLRFFLVPLPAQRGALVNLGKADWVFWWPLCVLCLAGLRRLVGLGPGALLVAVPAVSLVVFYAMLIGNVGTLLRYRSDLFPLFMVLGSLGIDELLGRIRTRSRDVITRAEPVGLRTARSQIS